VKQLSGNTVLDPDLGTTDIIEDDPNDQQSYILALNRADVLERIPCPDFNARLSLRYPDTEQSLG